MLKVVSFKICPFVQRVTAALEAKNVPYSIEFINLKNKPEWFLEISPTGQVPVVVTDDGISLFESDAIVEYIDDKYGPLELSLTPEEKALDRAWSYQASKHYLVQCGTMRSSDLASLREKESKLSKAFERAEQNLSEGPYFKGEKISKIDIAWLPLLHRAEIISRNSGFDFLEKYPKVKLWQTALLTTGLAEKSVSKDFEQVFSEFYLASSTYLGHLMRSRSYNGSSTNTITRLSDASVDVGSLPSSIKDAVTKPTSTTLTDASKNCQSSGHAVEEASKSSSASCSLPPGPGCC